MDSSTQNLETLKDIKKIMERSSRFISLSGWSGIAVGICALIGAYFANNRLTIFRANSGTAGDCITCLKRDLILIAAIVFIVSLILATLFTFIKTKKDGVAIWGNSAKRLLWNTMLPMIAGGFVIWRMIELNQTELLSSASLIFYGLALINGSKYTMGEVRYLGYAEIILGIINLWLVHQGLLCWAIGFGVFHIVYGIAMWWQHERNGEKVIGMQSGNKN